MSERLCLELDVNMQHVLKVLANPKNSFILRPNLGGACSSYRSHAGVGNIPISRFFIDMTAVSQM